MKQTLGKRIASLRKEQGMTQLELAEQMAVTDKAVSKWERDLSTPDINTLLKLAEIFHTSVDELMQQNTKQGNKVEEIVDTALQGIGLAMGIAVLILTILEEIDPRSTSILLGLGLASLSISLLRNK